MKTMLSYEAFVKGFKTLEENREYWNLDHDYMRAYRTIKITMDDWDRTTKNSIIYACDLLKIMLDASARIFKTA